MASQAVTGTTTTITGPGSADDSIIPGDIVALQHGQYGLKEGLVVGHHIDHMGRQIVEVQLEPGNVYHAWYPQVQRIKRVVHHQPVRVIEPARIAAPVRQRTVERHIYW